MQTAMDIWVLSEIQPLKSFIWNIFELFYNLSSKLSNIPSVYLCTKHRIRCLLSLENKNGQMQHLNEMLLNDR